MSFLDRRRRRKLLAEMIGCRRAEDDLLAPALRLRFDKIIDDLASAPAAEAASAVAKAEREFAALPLPHRNWMNRFLDLIFVVGAIAFALRGLFFQPFRIPTGSMQPTLFGIHHQTVEGNANFGFGGLSGLPHHLVYGSADASASVAAPGGMLESVASEPGMLFDRTRVVIGDMGYSLPGNPRQVADYAGLYPGRKWFGGETLGGGYVTLGDHLFVERLSLYFKPIRRGDIIVFNTENLESEVVFSGRPAEKIPLTEAGGYYYIKRVAALPGDTVKLADDQLWVRPAGASEFRRIQELEPRFAKVYSGKGGYQGHCKLDRETPTAEKPAYRALDFAYGQGEYRVPDAHYLMLGDNSRFSLDSRYFGAVPRRNMIGRAWFVFYPFSRRMGAVDRNAPLDEPTGIAGTATFEVMSKQ